MCYFCCLGKKKGQFSIRVDRYQNAVFYDK